MALQQFVQSRFRQCQPASLGVIVGCLCILSAGCGGNSKRIPTTADVAAIAASLRDVVYQCGSVAAGYIAEPDQRLLERDVRRLAGVVDRVRADAPFVLGSPPAARTTSLRKEVALAVHELNRDGCSHQQARRLQLALRG
jgi:hypothetical protein